MGVKTAALTDVANLHLIHFLETTEKFNQFSLNLIISLSNLTSIFFIFAFSHRGNRPTQLGNPYKTGTSCSSCKKSCKRKKLCMNSCPYADNWINCGELYATWPDWLCRTETSKGKDRLSHCKATCFCKGKIYDWQLILAHDKEMKSVQNIIIHTL